VREVKYSKETAIVSTIAWVIGLGMLLGTNTSLYQFIGTLLIGAGVVGPGILIWYFYGAGHYFGESGWNIPTKAVLLGLGAGLYAAVFNTIGIIYFQNRLLPFSLALDGVAILLIPVRASVLYDGNKT